jgi:hypothetical protein
MSKWSWILLGVLVVAVVILGAAWVSSDRSAAKPSGSSAAVGRTPATTSAPTPPPSPTAATPPATQPPRASGPARLAYADFLRRINDDRATVEGLNATLTTAVQALDPSAVRHAAVDILDFVDAERDWLRENPPAACYADAHASAGAMLDAYGAAADGFIAWAETGGGFAGLGALNKAVDAAKAAGDALTTFGKVLEATSCPA